MYIVLVPLFLLTVDALWYTGCCSCEAEPWRSQVLLSCHRVRSLGDSAVYTCQDKGIAG